MEIQRLAVFASGTGTNARNLIRYFREHPKGRVIRVWTNNPQAGVIAKAREEGVPVTVFTREELRSGRVLKSLQAEGTDWILLAGFLWLVPAAYLEAYRNRIVNIHPALLPKYGGKGMYGHYVHEAVIRAGDRESGITIHYCNEKYDAGQVIAQYRCPVLPDDTPESLADRVHALEMQWYPKVVEGLLG